MKRTGDAVLAELVERFLFLKNLSLFPWECCRNTLSIDSMTLCGSLMLSDFALSFSFEGRYVVKKRVKPHLDSIGKPFLPPLSLPIEGCRFLLPPHLFIILLEGR